MIFAKEIVFSKCIISKFSRLRRGYTPSNPLKFRACGAAIIQTIIQHIDDVESIIQIGIIQKQLFKRLMTIFWVMILWMIFGGGLLDEDLDEILVRIFDECDLDDGLQVMLRSPYNVKLARYEILTISNWRATVSLQCQTEFQTGVLW